MGRTRENQALGIRVTQRGGETTDRQRETAVTECSKHKRGLINTGERRERCRMEVQLKRVDFQLKNAPFKCFIMAFFLVLMIKTSQHVQYINSASFTFISLNAIVMVPQL